MAKEKMCEYSHSDHALPYWKCELWCCAQGPSFNIPDQEIDDNNANPTPSISFQIYHLIARCKKHGRLLFTDRGSFRESQQDNASGYQQKYALEKR